MKWCSACQQEHPESEFGIDRSRKDGLYRVCREAQRAKDRLRKRDREYTDADRAYGRERRRRIRILALQAYGGDPPACRCCGEDKIEFLSLEHSRGDGNTHRASVKGDFILALWRQGFPHDLGLEVLCFNCNLARGFHGYCPHERDAAVDNALLAVD